MPTASVSASGFLSQDVLAYAVDDSFGTREGLQVSFNISLLCFIIL